MTLSAGSRLGPYEILAPIGAGGMGEVYRAKDPRLGREVAIKVLPPSFSKDPDRLRRFEHEARAAGVLNHPNITAVYDIGSHEGAPYVVQELLEGETLRAVLAGGRLSPRKAIDYAFQTAHGLAAAHDKGIVHRDLKPENLFVTKGGRVKILDFGLAKLVHPEEQGPLTELPTGTAGTEPGVVLGTIGYMSPEQVRGQPADVRSDIFSFGAILHEMLSGQRAFSGGSAADTMTAILMKEPPELSITNKDISPGLERIVRHCLEKEPGQRFHSAHDLAFDLEALSGVTTGATSAAVATRRRAPPILLLVAAMAGLAALAVLAGHSLWRTRLVQPQFHRLTFRRGAVMSARFAPEGRTVVFGAAWEGNPTELFSTRLDSPESRPLGFADAALLGVSSVGELAMLARPRSSLSGGLGGYRGTLARAALAGGAPREILEDAVLADWTPDGSALAVVRSAEGQNRVELPIGHRLYETANNVLAMRVSPTGHLVALAEHPQGFGTNGFVSLLDLNGKKTTLAEGEVGDFADIAWAPSGQEIWFQFGISGGDSLKAVDLAGHRRLVLRVPGRMQLLDLSTDSRALINRVNWRVGILGVPPGQSGERDFSWLDASEVDDVSPDGRQLLITEFGEGGDTQRWSVYLRRTDGSPAIRLGDGQAMALSPDGKWALAMLRTEPPQLVMFPTGPGEPIKIPNRGISDYYMADWLADGKRILFTGVQPGHGPRCYLQGVDGENLRAVTPEGTILPLSQPALSPDIHSFVAIGPDHVGRLYAVDGGGPRPIPGMQAWEIPLRWSADGRALYVAGLSQLPLRVDRLDISTGTRTLWKEITPSDPAGVTSLYAIQISPEQGWYFYSYWRVLSDLYVVDGLR
jgi:eukaryotic-like serine/threonine-protein kinase